MVDCDDLIRPALSSTLDEFEISRDENSCQVTTPFRHSNGDLIRVWIQHIAEEYYSIRDYGETFAMLRLYGVNPMSDANTERVSDIRTEFGLETDETELVARAPADELGGQLLDVIQAIQAVSYLRYTHRSQPPSRFNSKVDAFLEDAGYSFEPGFTVPGETHSRTFDFGINHREPGVLLDTVHTSNEYTLRQQVDGVMLNWHEIQDEDYSHGALVDDVDGIYEEQILERIIDNLDYFFRWSEKERITQEIPITAEGNR